MSNIQGNALKPRNELSKPWKYIPVSFFPFLGSANFEFFLKYRCQVLLFPFNRYLFPPYLSNHLGQIDLFYESLYILKLLSVNIVNLRRVW